MIQPPLPQTVLDNEALLIRLQGRLYFGSGAFPTEAPEISILDSGGVRENPPQTAEEADSDVQLRSAYAGDYKSPRPAIARAWYKFLRLIRVNAGQEYIGVLQIAHEAEPFETPLQDPYVSLSDIDEEEHGPPSQAETSFLMCYLFHASLW